MPVLSVPRTARSAYAVAFAWLIYALALSVSADALTSGLLRRAAGNRCNLLRSPANNIPEEPDSARETARDVDSLGVKLAQPRGRLGTTDRLDEEVSVWRRPVRAGRLPLLPSPADPSLSGRSVRILIGSHTC